MTISFREKGARTEGCRGREECVLAPGHAPSSFRREEKRPSERMFIEGPGTTANHPGSRIHPSRRAQGDLDLSTLLFEPYEGPGKERAHWQCTRDRSSSSA